MIEQESTDARLARVEATTEAMNSKLDDLLADLRADRRQRGGFEQETRAAITASNGIHADHEARVRALETWRVSITAPATSGWSRAQVTITAVAAFIALCSLGATVVIALAHA